MGRQCLLKNPRPEYGNIIRLIKRRHRFIYDTSETNFSPFFHSHLNLDAVHATRQMIRKNGCNKAEFFSIVGGVRLRCDFFGRQKQLYFNDLPFMNKSKGCIERGNNFYTLFLPERHSAVLCSFFWPKWQTAFLQGRGSQDSAHCTSCNRKRPFSLAFFKIVSIIFTLESDWRYSLDWRMALKIEDFMLDSHCIYLFTLAISKFGKNEANFR